MMRRRLEESRDRPEVKAWGEDGDSRHVGRLRGMGREEGQKEKDECQKDGRGL